MDMLKSTIREGLPEALRDVPYKLHDYFPVRDELVVQDSVVFKVNRVVIPPTLKPEMMDRVHAVHIGVQGCLRRARDAIF